MIRLVEIRQREQAATPGPWRVIPGDEWCQKSGNADGIASLESDHADIVMTDAGMYPPNQADAAFIAEARSDVPWLLAEVDRLKSLLSSCVLRSNVGFCVFCRAFFRGVDPPQKHMDDCPAFTPEGVVR